MTEAEQLFRRYQEMQQYVGWTDDDARHVRDAAPLLEPRLPALIEDFYDELDRHPQARKVITGGQEQIARLKATLLTWLQDLLTGPYDREYVTRRWQVGWRHVEIGLEQVYTNVALARLRDGLSGALEQAWHGSAQDLWATLRSLDKLLDLDLAEILDAYQTEHSLRQQQSERLATMGRVAGGVAHELRNPLNVVKTSVYYLSNARQLSPEKMAEHLQRIERQVTLADDVITALSDFAKLPLAELRPVSVPEWIEDALASASLPENVDVALDFPPDLPAVLADPRQVRIALRNLIRNAGDAMPEGGRLSFIVRPSGLHVEVAVGDTGLGIAPEDLRRIMEPFYSTKARGIGLGLAMTRAILDKNNGQLTVVSEPGKGSTFTVRLAAAPQ